MGLLFDLAQANYVAYLTTPGDIEPPRMDFEQLDQFIGSLELRHYGGEPELLATFISSEDRVVGLLKLVCTASERLAPHLPPGHSRSGIEVPGFVVRKVLEPLKSFFCDRDLYGMVISRQYLNQRITPEVRFFERAARASGGKTLMLMPMTDGNPTRIIDPFQPLRILAEYPVSVPAVVFWTFDRKSFNDVQPDVCALPFSEAQQFYDNALRESLSLGRGAVAAAIRDRIAKTTAKHILQLSDLHFGDSTADSRRRYIKGHLDTFDKKIDCVLITGDLFDTPNRKLRNQYMEFRSDLSRVLNKRDVIIVPGNHDVRKMGIVGNNYEFVFDLGFRSIVVEEELGCVFFCFNSVEGGQLARGLISDEQLTRSAAEYEELVGERKRLKKPDLKDFLKICVLHHHPVAYETVPTTLYDKFVRIVTRNEDSLTRLENADRFLKWCADREIALIVHGHKHVPRHVRLKIAASNERNRTIEVVGCGSTTGVENSELCYVIISVDPTMRRWGISFYHDPSATGAGFRSQEIAIDTRLLRASW